MRYLLFILGGLVLGLSFPAGDLRAQNLPGAPNLLTNPAFESAPGQSNMPAGWTVTPAGKWQRTTQLTAPGAPYEMAVIQWQDGGSLYQGPIAVATNTWYVLSARYRAPLSPQSNSHNFWLYATPPDAASYERIGGGTFGASPEWAPARAFFNSGTNPAVRWRAWFFGAGTCAVSECGLRPVAEADLAGPFLMDGDFEKGQPGLEPADYWGMNKTAQAVVVEGGGFPTGNKSIRLEVPQGGRLDLRGPACLCKPGVTLKYTAWAKASVPGFVLGCTLNRGNGFLRFERQVILSREWQKIEVVGLVPTDLPELQLFGIYMGGQAGAPVTVWLDETKLEVIPAEPAARRAAPAGKNLIPHNSSFEAGTWGWDWRFCSQGLAGQTFEPGAARIDTNTAAEGRNSLCLKVPGGENSALNSALFAPYFPAEADQKYTVSFWAKADRPAQLGVYLTPRYRSAGSSVAVGGEWKRYAVAIAPPADMLKESRGYLALRFHLRTGATYWLDAIQLEKGATQTEYAAAGRLEIGADCNRLYPFYVAGEKPEATLYLSSRLDRESKLEWSYTVKDWRDQVVDRGQQQVRVPAGATVAQTVPLFAGQQGVFVTTYAARDPASGAAAEALLVYGIFPPVRAVDPEQSFFGVHEFVMAHEGRLVLRGGTLDDFFKLYPIIGARWNRSFFLGSWALHEPEPGQWRWCDPFVDTALSNGVKLLPCLGSGLTVNCSPMPKWAWSDKPAPKREYDRGLEAFYPKPELWQNFVREYIRHYGDRIDVFGIMNETGGLEPEPYVEFTRLAFEAAREINPRARISAPEYPCNCIPAGPDDKDWISDVMRLGLYNYLDVYSGHFYWVRNYGRYGVEPEGGKYGNIEKKLQWLLNYLQEAYGNKPVWDTEFGIVSGPTAAAWMQDPLFADDAAVTPRIQAERLIRWMTIKKAAGIKKIFFHVFSNDAIHYQGGHNLTDGTMAPRPATVAFAQMARRLDLAGFKQKLELGGSAWVYLFELEGQPVAVYWDYETPQGGQLVLPLAPADVIVEDLMGNPVTPRILKDKRLALPLDTSPVYVRPRALSGADLLARFEQAEILGVKAGYLNVTLSHTNGIPAVAAGFYNLLNAPVSVTVRINGLPNGWAAGAETVTIADIPSQTEGVGYRPLTAWAGAPDGEKISVSGKIGEQVFQAERAVKLARAVRAPGRMVLDGAVTEEEYGPAPRLELNRPDQVINEATKWESLGKATAAARLVWDEDALYVGIEVTDDRVLNPAPDDLLFQGDSVEVYLDTATAADICSPAYHDHQGKFIAAPAPDGNGPGRIFCKGEKGTLRGLKAKKARVFSRRTAAGYTLEIVIPAAHSRLAAGLVWGFDFSVIDFDGAETGARSQLVWAGKAPWETPRDFGFLLFNPAP